MSSLEVEVDGKKITIEGDSESLLVIAAALRERIEYKNRYEEVTWHKGKNG